MYVSYQDNFKTNYSRKTKFDILRFYILHATVDNLSTKKNSVILVTIAEMLESSLSIIFCTFLMNSLKKKLCDINTKS